MIFEIHAMSSTNPNDLHVDFILWHGSFKDGQLKIWMNTGEDKKIFFSFQSLDCQFSSNVEFEHAAQSETEKLQMVDRTLALVNSLWSGVQIAAKQTNTIH